MKLKEFVINIDDENCLQFLKNEIAILNFFSDWHMTCLMVHPILEELAEEFSDRIFFGKVDVEEYEKLAERYSIEKVPTLIIFKKGAQVDRIESAISEEALREKISSLVEI
jgi:thioredoxin 1